MKCCSKTVVGLAVAAGLGVAIIAATGVGPAIWNRVVHKFEKQVDPELQIEQLKIDIGKLDKDIDKNWTMIATYEHEVKSLRSDLEKKQVIVKNKEKELASAGDELADKNLQRITFEGKAYNRPEAGRLLNKEVDLFVALKREVASKEKLLAAREQKLAAAMTNQKSIMTQKEELKTNVAKLEADLETLKLRRSEAKLPVTETTRLDKIKTRMSKLQTDIEIETRALEMRDQATGSSFPGEPKEKVDLNDSVVKRVREALGQENVAKDDN